MTSHNKLSNVIVNLDPMPLDHLPTNKLIAKRHGRNTEKGNNVDGFGKDMERVSTNLQSKLKLKI